MTKYKVYCYVNNKLHHTYKCRMKHELLLEHKIVQKFKKLNYEYSYWYNDGEVYFYFN